MSDYSIDGYTIGELIGMGFYGQVFEGKRDSDGLDVAIKITRNAEREIETLKSLKSSYVIEMLDYGKTSEGLEYDYLVMPILPHKADRLRLSQRAFVELGYQVSQAILAIDEAGYVHKDLHMGNIMLDDEGKVKIIDFGAAFKHDDANEDRCIDVRVFSDRVDFVLDANRTDYDAQDEWYSLLSDHRQDSPEMFAQFWSDRKRQEGVTGDTLLLDLI